MTYKEERLGEKRKYYKKAKQRNVRDVSRSHNRWPLAYPEWKIVGT